MKSKFSLFLVSALVLGFVSCTKSSTAPYTGVPNFTINNNTTSLTGISGAQLSSTSDSVFNFSVENYNTTDSTKLNSLATDYVNIVFSANKAIKTGTYGSGGTNLLNMSIISQYNGQLYYGGFGFSGFFGNKYSVTISSLTSTAVSGSYSAVVYEDSNDSPTIITGHFQASF